MPSSEQLIQALLDQVPEGKITEKQLSEQKEQNVSQLRLALATDDEPDSAEISRLANNIKLYERMISFKKGIDGIEMEALAREIEALARNLPDLLDPEFMDDDELIAAARDILPTDGMDLAANKPHLKSKKRKSKRRKSKRRKSKRRKSKGRKSKRRRR